MTIPYLKEVDVLKLLDKFIVVVHIDDTFANQKFETSDLAHILSHLNKKLNNINKNL